MKKFTALLLVLVMALAIFAGCTPAAPTTTTGKQEPPATTTQAPPPTTTVAPEDPAPNCKTSTYDEMVAWMIKQGFIAEGTTPVDMNTTAGYCQDNTGGNFPFFAIADKADDYNGLYLIWWDLSNEAADTYERYVSAMNNSGTIVYMGGAAILSTASVRGAFAIGFAEDFAQKDAVLEAFNALEKK